MTVAERFWSKVDKTDDCWLWTAATGNNGYGSFSVDGVVLRVHRFAYEFLVGPIPSGMMIDHVCHVKTCVNPAHLRPVTRKQNMENQAGAHRNSSTGERGVFPSRSGRYCVAIQSDKVLYHFGTYDTIEEAREVARLKRIELFTHNDKDRT